MTNNASTVKQLINFLETVDKKLPVAGEVEFLDFEGEGWTDIYPVTHGKKTPAGIQLKGASTRAKYDKQLSYKDWIQKTAITVQKLLEALKTIEDKDLPILVKNITHKKYEQASYAIERDAPYGHYICIQGSGFHKSKGY